MHLSWTNIHYKKKVRWRKPEGKLSFRKLPQRVGGWCEPTENRRCSTFQAADESRKGKPFTAVQEVRSVLGNLGGNAGIYSRPCLLLGREFFVLKAFSNGWPGNESLLAFRGRHLKT